MAERGASGRPPAGILGDRFLIKTGQKLVTFGPGRGGLEEAFSAIWAGGGGASKEAPRGAS